MKSWWLNRRSLLFLLWLPVIANGQQHRKDLETLCSPEFAGRGYVDGGMEKASSYIADAFKEAGLKKVKKSYFQEFTMPVNTFPSVVEMRVDGRKLVPGTDFLVRATSCGIKGQYNLVHVSLENILTDSAFQELRAHDYSRAILVLDTMTFDQEEVDKRYKKIQFNNLNAAGVIIKSKRSLLWTVGTEQASYASFEVLPSAISLTDKTVELNVEAFFQRQFKARNVMGMVKGTEVPDSFLFVTAHYDHLGKMGSEVYFPGGNDNASGTAMLLSLARYYAKNPLRYSIMFVAFASEEAGLIGSRHFVENSPVDLKSIRFLMNLDLHGTGADGITVVNATVYTQDFDLLVSLNADGGYLKLVAPRGKAANSDHHWFTEKGVPCFFIYQMGEYGHYHDPGDNWDKLPLSEFEDTQLLIREFFGRLSGL